MADIQDEGILRMDFLRPHSCLVNLEDIFQIHGEELPLQRPLADQIQTFSVISEETVDLPPHAESIVRQKGYLMGVSDGEYWSQLWRSCMPQII